MRWRFILSLVFLSTGLTLLELKSGAQVPTPAPVPTIDIASLLNQIGFNGLGTAGISGISGIAGTSGTSGTAGAAVTPTPGRAQAAPIASEIPPLPDRTQTDTPADRIQSTLNTMRRQNQQRRTRTFEAGTVMPGQGLSNRNLALAATLPPRHTVESVLAGQESAGELLAYTAFTSAANQAVLDLATVLAANNPFDPFLGIVRPASTQPTTLPAVPTTTQPASATTIPTKRKLRVTAEELFNAQTIQEFNDELLQNALETLITIPGQQKTPNGP